MRLSYGVITATLNAGEHVARAIDSVFAQSVLPREYIVIDGGSTDATLEEARSRADRAERLGLPIRFRILRQSVDGGIAAAWNEAIPLVDTDVVFLLNADDRYEPHAARAVLRAFEDDPAAGIVHAKARFLRPDGTTLGICAPCWVNRLHVQCRTVHCATFVRRGIYAKVGGFDPAYRTTLDFEFLERCHHAGVRFKYLDDIVSNFRLGGVSYELRDQADRESLRIGLRHSTTKVAPIAAFLVRRLLMRPLGIAGFDFRLRRERSQRDAAKRSVAPLLPKARPAR